MEQIDKLLLVIVSFSLLVCWMHLVDRQLKLAGFRDLKIQQQRDLRKFENRVVMLQLVHIQYLAVWALRVSGVPYVDADI